MKTSNLNMRVSRLKGVEATEAAVHGPAGASRAATPKVELYQKENCRFSHSVRKRLTELGLDFVAHTVPDGNELKHMHLVRAGGKDKIPFLIDHGTGVKLFESTAIIAYLDKEYGNPPAGRLERLLAPASLALRTRADQLGWAVRMPIDKAGAAVRDVQAAVRSLRESVSLVRGIFRDAYTASRNT